MREIKFRAWDDLKEKMIHNVSLDLKTGWWSYFGSSSGTVFDEGLIKVGAKNGKPPVMQFTGLKDKNGKDIYEDDILGGIFRQNVSGKENLFQGQVKYHKCRYAIYFKDGTQIPLENFPSRVLVQGSSELEIIGNIHQN